ncbi:MAG: TlpA family protein disulfide reductase [Bacteroidales bacterium]|nr:TlpA family protein disulfide reductase [Bacteroidales bacterium]
MRFILLHIILVFAFLLPQKASSEVRIHGTAEDYAGYHLEIYRYADYITKTRELMGVVMIDSVGHFDYNIDVNDVTYAFLDLSSYRAHIYIEPNTEYEVALPPFRPRPDADRFNPFYQPENIELGIINSTGCLNEAIRNFDEFFASTYHSNAIELVRTRNIKKADAIIAKCDSVALQQRCEHDFFKKYVQFREVQVFSTPRLRNVRTVLQQKFAHENVAYEVPSYWDALGLIGQSFIASHIKTRHGAALEKVLKYNPPTFADISDALIGDTAVFTNTELREAIILKGIYDGYYTGYFASGQTDTMLITATNQAQIDKSKKIAFDILQKKNRLKPGTLAPDFVLLDTNGKEHTLKDMRGKFVYLAFMHTQNYSCMKDVPALSGIQRKYKRDMIVVGIMTDEESDKIGNYFQNKKIEWTLLSYNYMQSVVLDYGVESLPTYFVIDPEGRIAIAPAPAPTEKFESAIAGEIRKYKKESLKKNAPRERNIYDIVNYSY